MRDKDLRQRLSSFLAGARQKMLRARLRAKIRKFKARKSALWRELGQKAWNKDIRDSHTVVESEKLEAIEEEIQGHQMKWHETLSLIDELNHRQEEIREKFRVMLREEETGRKPLIEEMNSIQNQLRELVNTSSDSAERLESAAAELKGLDKEVHNIRKNLKITEEERISRIRKNDELKRSLHDLSRELQEKISSLETEQTVLRGKQQDTQERIDIINEKIREITGKNQESTLNIEREIKESEKAKNKIQARIVELKRQMEPLYETMGKALDRSRPEDKELEILYFEIDGTEKSIRDLEARIEKLH
jgi:chromosome segregation ATPase